MKNKKRDGAVDLERHTARMNLWREGDGSKLRRMKVQRWCVGGRLVVEDYRKLLPVRWRV